MCRCAFSTPLNSSLYVVPAECDGSAKTIICTVPPKRNLDGTTEGTANVAISTNGVTFSTTSLQFNYYQQATFDPIAAPYIFIGLTTTCTITGHFPLFAPHILLQTSHSAQTSVILSASSTQLVFAIDSTTFAFGDAVELLVSFDDTYSYQRAPFVFKCIHSAKLNAVVPNVLQLGKSKAVSYTHLTLPTNREV
eukprot:TRINITY_DN24710_c0_g1_i1.p1 TRINITY_DN24710_c0_g1~~TRINITY_DN24710_c0_g1_i1.p1  ORF type:complete len:194 (+),score=28.25 TRINITY_DN24710_c0_g1_i1:181-762(+)